jgi:hypothetical protein
LHILNVMAGLVPAIHACLRLNNESKNVDARDRPGHNEEIVAGYSAGPANSSRLPSGSLTIKSFAPQGSLLSV